MGRARRLLHLSFRDRMTFALAAVALLSTLCISGAFFNISSSVINQMSARLAERNARWAYGMIESKLNDAYHGATRIVRLDSLSDILKTGGTVDGELSARFADETSDVVTRMGAEGEVSLDYVALFCKNGYSYSSKADVRLAFGDYRSCLDYYVSAGYWSGRYKPPVWTELISVPDRLGGSSRALVQVRMLYHPYTFEEEGVLLIAVAEEQLREEYADWFPEAMIFNQNGVVISASDPERLNASVAGTQVYELSGRLSAGSGMTGEDVREEGYFLLPMGTLFFSIPYEHYSAGELSEMSSFRLMSGLVSAFTLLAALGLSLWLSRSLYHSIRRVKDVVDDVRRGNLKVRYTAKREDELSYLGNSFNEMLDRLDVYYATQQAAEESKKNLELRLLQSQINPHLLYNSLNSALLSLDDHDTETAKALLIHLSGFFKMSLARGSDVTTLQNELELIFHYIEIQRLARDKKHQVLLEVQESLRQVRILKLILQPLVENAVIHGFSGYRDDGRILISAAAEDGALAFCVEDNGIGLSPGRIAELSALLETYPPPADMKAFGLYNVDRRLKRRYGQGCGLRIESEVGAYTRIRFAIPYGNSDGGDADV